MKKTAALILTAAVSLTAIPVMGESSFEKEIASYPWAREGVEYCYNNGIITGDEFGDLNLGGNLTRAQMARIFTDTFNLSKASSSDFKDVKETDWFYEYSLTIQNSMPKKDADFNGGEYVTREEFAATLVKASGKKAADSYTITNRNFTDAADVDDAYKNLMETAVLEFYMRGDNGKILPKNLLTRAEAATFLYRAINPDAELTPITGSAEVTCEQAIAWAKSKGAAERFINVAPLYWSYGEQFGIRPEVMYAQAGKETAYGNYGGAVLPEMNNWAGIKIKNPTGDTTEDHETFLTPEDGVRAHFNHMSAYIGVAPIGEPHDRYYVVMSMPWAGTIKYVELLGGRWCPDINYGCDILKMVENMKNY